AVGSAVQSACTAMLMPVQTAFQAVTSAPETAVQAVIIAPTVAFQAIFRPFQIASPTVLMKFQVYCQAVWNQVVLVAMATMATTSRPMAVMTHPIGDEIRPALTSMIATRQAVKAAAMA